MNRFCVFFLLLFKNTQYMSPAQRRTRLRRKRKSEDDVTKEEAETSGGGGGGGGGSSSAAAAASLPSMSVNIIIETRGGAAGGGGGGGGPPRYLPSDRISGLLEVTVRRVVDVLCLRVKCSGREKLSFPKGSTRRKASSAAAAAYASSLAGTHSVVLFKQVNTIYGPHPGDDIDNSHVQVPASTQLVAGRYRFPFSFQLPEILPPSCVASFERRKASKNDDAAAETAAVRVVYAIKAYADLTGPRSRDVVSVLLFDVVVPMTALQRTFLEQAAEWGTTPRVSLRKEPSSCCIKWGCVSDAAHQTVMLQMSCGKHVLVFSEGKTAVDAVLDDQPSPFVSVPVTVHVTNPTPEPVHHVYISLRNRVVVRGAAGGGNNTTTSGSARLVEHIVSWHRVKMEVPPNGGQAQASIDVDVRTVAPGATLRSPLPPTMVSHLMRSKWFIGASFISRDDDAIIDGGGCCCANEEEDDQTVVLMPIVVAQCIDPANRFHSQDFVEAAFPAYPKGYFEDVSSAL